MRDWVVVVRPIHVLPKIYGPYWSRKSANKIAIKLKKTSSGNMIYIQKLFTIN